MNKIRLDYEQPSCDLLVVRFEEGILTVSNPNAVRSNSSSSGYDDDNDLGEI